jgi:Protein of unknown function (DUF3089)
LYAQQTWLWELGWLVVRRHSVYGMALTLTVGALLSGCGGGSSPGPKVASATGTVWLCRPGQASDPCAASLQATVVPARGARTVQSPSSGQGQSVDCFYVYPTVSGQTTANANLTVQATEVGAAISQASRFSQVCRVWAPMYRQRTETSLAEGLGADPHADNVAYESLLAAWDDYLKNDNDGRPIVFIGHSQGAAVLIRLLRSQVDSVPALRKRIVLMILAGGNVTVPTGKTVGSTFRHLPLCTASGQDHCVIAYSSFPSKPPPDTVFGRPGRGVSLQSDQTAKAGLQVACVNPAAIGGGPAPLDPYFLAAGSGPITPRVTTPWVTYPGLYEAACRTDGSATWLQVDTSDVAGRPVVSELAGPAWGYHQADINLALGNLVDDVAAAESAFSSAR